MFVGGPAVEIMCGLAWKHVLPEIGPQGKKIILQPGRELWLRQGAHVRPDEGVVQEADDQGRMIGIEQPPGRMPASQRFKRAVIHCRTPMWRGESNTESCSPSAVRRNPGAPPLPCYLDKRESSFVLFLFLCQEGIGAITVVSGYGFRARRFARPGMTPMGIKP